MIISIHKNTEKEFLKLKPYFKYCFSKDKRKGQFKEYHFNTNKMSLKKEIEYCQKFRLFKELDKKETLKKSIIEVKK